MAVRTRQNNTMTEVWNRTSWANWDTYQAVTNGTTMGREPDTMGGFLPSVATQRHVNLRSFLEGAWTASTGGTIVTGNLSSYNHWPGATITAPVGTTTYTSQYTNPIDLTVLGSGSQLVLTMPAFPSGITLNASSIELSDSNWSSVLTLPFSASATVPSSASYVSFPYSALNTGVIDLSKVTNVRINITATGSPRTVVVMGMKLIDNNWVYTNVDFNNIHKRLVSTMPLNGDTNVLGTLPTNQFLPTLWRSAYVPGIDDPRPINAEMSFIFNTGSQTGANSFAYYMREQTQAFQTQITLQGQPQSTLTGSPQPTGGFKETLPRPISDLEQYKVGDLDSTSMINLEGTSHPAFSSWVRFRVQWGTTSAIQVTNSSDPIGGFQYTGLTFANNTTYVAICNLTDSNAQLQIYNVDQTTLQLGTLLYDTTIIPDAFLFPRRAGRTGFNASIVDGDSYVGAIRPRSMMFAEYRSKPLRSITPVEGAHLFVQNTQPLSLFTGWTPVADGSGNSPTMAVDQQRYSPKGSDTQSINVTVSKASTAVPAQGLVSNVLSKDNYSGITDFGHLDIAFDVYIPSAAINGGTIPGKATILTAALTSGTVSIPIALPEIQPDQWQHIALYQPVPPPFPQSGLYQLSLYYNGVLPTQWWIDEVIVNQDVVDWSARSVVDDPWHSNYAPWTPFRATLNSHNDGVAFTTIGKDLQIRGRGLQQGTAIASAPTVIPQYAGMGNLVWGENTFQSLGAITCSIAPSNVGRTYTFVATASSPNGVPGGGNGIVNYQWSFGDGFFGSGISVTHTYGSWYPIGASFTAYLTVYDRAGFSASTSTIVTVT